MNCAFHQQVPALLVCGNCGRFHCVNCARHLTIGRRKFEGCAQPHCPGKLRSKHTKWQDF